MTPIEARRQAEGVIHGEAARGTLEWVTGARACGMSLEAADAEIKATEAEAKMLIERAFEQSAALLLAMSLGEWEPSGRPC